MKKILAMVMSVAMILSLFTVVAAAGTPGKFQTSEDTFTPVGDMKITWDTKVSDKIKVTDGDMQDWADAGYTMYNITPENMVSWVDEANKVDPTTTSMPENWQLQAYFVADPDYLYIGFYVKDDDVVLAQTGDNRDGDGFQLSIDFDNILGQSIEADPEDFNEESMKCVFYSFSPQSADPNPIRVQIQQTDGDRDGWVGSGDDTGIPTSDQETIYDDKADILGATSLTETGWQAEFAISWNQFYADLTYKTYSEEAEFYVGEENHLDLSCALYYLNYDHLEDGSNSGVTWAAGTLKGQEADVQPEVTWSPADNGMTMYLEWFQGLEINCDGVTVLAEGETIPPVVEETEAEETEAPADTAAGTTAEEGTAAEGTEAGTSAEAGTTADTTATDEGGCASVVGFGAATVLMAAAAAAVVLKKKD